jgi:hypothetical protein
MDKQKLSKLASLNNNTANKFLLNFALSKRVEVPKYKTNEEIIDTLDYLSAIFYRVPKVVIEICVEILYRKKGIKTQKFHHGLKGEDWRKVQVKTLELLKNIRYYELEKTVKIAFDFASHKDLSVRSTTLKLIEEIAEYNYQAITHVNLDPQNIIFKYIKKHALKDDFETNFNPIKITIEKMLETSADATILTAPDTITLRKGDLNGTDNLKDLRQKIIDFIFLIYKKSEKNVTKTLVVQLLAHACQFPMNSERTSPIGLIIQANREYIISELDKVMFDKKGKLKASLSFCLEIEHLLFWHFIFHKQQNEIAQPLYDKITKDPLYEKFSRFVHDDSIKYEIGSGEQQKQNRENVIDYVKNVTNLNINKITDELNLFATETDVIGEWKFRTLQLLLETLGTHKPEIGLTVLQDAIKYKKPLSNQMFLAFLLRGIRLSRKYEIWHKGVDSIIKTKDPDFIGSIPASLHIYADIFTDLVLRKEDLTLLTNLTNRKKYFNFLAKKKHSWNINYSTTNALRALYNLNPKKIENLIVAELKSEPHFLENYLNILSIYSGKEGGIDFSEWSDKNKKFIASKIIEVPVIDWHIHSLLDNLYSNPVDIIRIFIERIKKEAKLNKSMSDYFDRNNRYDAIPFDMNNHLVEHVINHKDYLKIVPEIIKASKSKEGAKRKYDLAKLNEHFGISPHSILEILTGGKKITDKVIQSTLGLIYDFNGIGIELAVKLASYTNNEKILKKIGGMLHNTGVVSGQYGIADFYKSQWMVLEKYKDDTNPNIRKFVELSLPSLKSSDERARKEADQDKEKRRIDFETNS